MIFPSTQSALSLLTAMVACAGLSLAKPFNQSMEAVNPQFDFSSPNLGLTGSNQVPVVLVAVPDKATPECPYPFAHLNANKTSSVVCPDVSAAKLPYGLDTTDGATLHDLTKHCEILWAICWFCAFLDIQCNGFAEAVGLKIY